MNFISPANISEDEGTHFCPPVLNSSTWDALLSNPNPALFKTESGHAISFFLQFSSKTFHKFVRLIEDYGGRVECTKDDIKPHTAVLVDLKEDPRRHDRAVFKVNYVIDCAQEAHLLNIKEYLYNKVSPFSEIDLMSILYWETKSSFEMHKALEDCAESSKRDSSDDISDVDCVADTECTIDSLRVPPVSINSHNKVDEAQKLTTGFQNRPIKRHLDPPDIDDWVRKDNDSDVSEPLLSHLDKRAMKENSNTGFRKLDVNKKVADESGTFKTQPINKLKNYVREPTSKYRNEDDSESESSEPMMQPLVHQYVDKHSRKPFSKTEQLNILKYIIENKGFDRVKGIAFWKEMESKRINPARTFESLRNHFLRTILPKIESYNYINPKYMKKFISIRKGTDRS